MNKRNKHLRLKILSWLFTIVFCIGFIVLFPQYMGEHSLYKSGVHTKGTIIEIESIIGAQESTRGMVQYIDQSGMIHKYYGFLGYHLDYGDSVDIVYEYANPEHSIIGDTTRITFGMIFSIVFALLAIFMLYLSILITFFSKDRKQVFCACVEVDDDELARVVREYMPQTRDNFFKNRKKNKDVDRLGRDTIVERLLALKDPIKEIYDNYSTIIENGDIFPCAVVRVTDNDIYNQMIDINSPSVETGESRYTVLAIVVYSMDNYFVSHPSKLKQVADNLNFINPQYIDLKVSDYEVNLMNAIQDNNQRFFNLKYNGVLSYNKDVFISTVILDKFHLCNAKLSNKLMYIVANPSRTPYSAILPSWYYSLWELSSF